jgi:hypothetical protein
MKISDKTIDIIGYGFMSLVLMATLTGCPDNKSSEETGPASRGETSTDSGGESGPKPQV